MCPPCMRGVCCTVSCNGSEKTAAPFTNGLQVFHLPFRFGVYTAYISRRESRFPAPPLIREKKPFFQIHPYGPLPAREESQTGRPTIPPQASGVLIDLFIHDLSKARRGAGFENRRPAQRIEKVFSPLSKFSELLLSSENLGFQWRRTPFLGFPRTPFTRKGYAASVKRQSR